MDTDTHTKRMSCQDEGRDPQAKECQSLPAEQQNAGERRGAESSSAGTGTVDALISGFEPT